MKKFTLACIGAFIALTAFLILSPICFDSGEISAEALDNTEADSSISEETDDDNGSIRKDIYIFLKSRMYLSLSVASEEEIESLPDPEVPEGYESLNEARFSGWTDEDYFCNDYLRAFRRYMDAWLQGWEMDEKEADPSVLEPYRERLNGKFLIYQVRPFMFGGLLYLLIPVEDPALMLVVWVFSVVDYGGHIEEYQVQYAEVVWDVEEELREAGISKEEARRRLLELAGDGVESTLW